MYEQQPGQSESSFGSADVYRQLSGSEAPAGGAEIANEPEAIAYKDEGITIYTRQLEGVGPHLDSRSLSGVLMSEGGDSSQPELHYGEGKGMYHGEMWDRIGMDGPVGFHAVNMAGRSFELGVRYSIDSRRADIHVFMKGDCDDPQVDEAIDNIILHTSRYLMPQLKAGLAPGIEAPMVSADVSRNDEPSEFDYYTQQQLDDGEVNIAAQRSIG
jgi:hypothetical protein